MSYIERINTRIETADDLMSEADALHDDLGDLLGKLRRRLDCARATGGIASLERLEVSLKVASMALKAALDEMEASI
ncbi:hypothetical protein RADP37_05408 (plasmid) [Roseomonas mucosa]|uniref:Uncharacterized protein n=1 Tax=Roseomonas mucosa TaxID=207340 RepID=A0A4Y1MQS2_9PROT|nr:hypothetical protein [Roseomonas mucosa]AWV20331.1 hypothetical protein RADP37_05408 [Roseomonas mucosa]